MDPTDSFCVCSFEICLFNSKTFYLDHEIKKSKAEITYSRNPLWSVFRHDGKPDIILKQGEEIFSISVLTTPYRKVRYHFSNNEKLEIVIERRGTYVMNPRAYGNNASMDRVYTFRKYKIKYDVGQDHCQKYVILHPSPRSVSKAQGSTLVALGNDDLLFHSIKICGLRYFLDNIIENKKI